jgi:hypothetical protein
MPIVIDIHITLDDSNPRQCSVSGTIEDELLCYGAIEKAKQGIAASFASAQQSRILQPSTRIDPRRLKVD